MSDATATVWQSLAAPLAAGSIAFRQEGTSFQRDGKTIARFVAYVEAGDVRERLDAVVPGEWTFSLEPLPAAPDADGVLQVAFKARLTIKGVFREDVGLGRDGKASATDALKRCAAQFRIGAETRDMSVFVQLEDDQKGARPIEEPSAAWRRKSAIPARPSAREVPRPPIRSAALADVRAVPKPSSARPPEPPPLDDDDLPF